MKVNRHGKAKILAAEEIQVLFSQGFETEKARVLFSVCLFTACRIREATTLLVKDVYNRGAVNSHLTIRKSSTKNKLATRSIPVADDLRKILSDYYPQIKKEIYLFPGRCEGHISHDSAARIFRKACEQVGIIGASTHSFRRTSLSWMSDSNIPIRVIAEISGHKSMDVLQKYLEVRDDQLKGAIASLAMLSPVAEVGEVKKIAYDDIVKHQ